jgi:hypothetical protein
MSTYSFRGKAITLIEPWATAIAYAGKTIENRSWYTHYRGPLAIHAGARIDRTDLDYVVRQVPGGPKKTLEDWIRRGVKQNGGSFDELLQPSQVIAIAMLVDCVAHSSSPWFGGIWGFVLEGVIPIRPIPKKGRLGLWDCKFNYQLR